MFDLSIITINFNTPQLLSDLLKSLDKIRLTDELNFEVILVNVTPDDGSEIMVKKSFPWVKQIVDRRNLGFSGNNNLGIAESTGRYVLFLNSDTAVPQGTLLEMVRFMDQSAGTCALSVAAPPWGASSSKARRERAATVVKDCLKEVGAATCYIELAGGGMDPDCHRGFPTPRASLTYFLGLEKLFPKSKLFGQYHQSYLPLNEIHEIDACAGAFLLLRREVGEKIDSRKCHSGTERSGAIESPEENPKSEFRNSKQIQSPNVQNPKRFGHLNFGNLGLLRISNFVLRIWGRPKEGGLPIPQSQTLGNSGRPQWWDEDFFFYGEDLDLCYRVKEAGYKIMFYPHVKITHHKGASSGIRKESKEVTKATEETRKRLRRETTRAMRLFYQKHYENKYPRIVTALVYFGIAVIEKLRGLK